MIIYKGEELIFEGHLRDDAGAIITDLSEYSRISLILKRDGDIQVTWSTVNIDGAYPITIGSGGLLRFTLPDNETRGLDAGAYSVETKLTKSDGSIVIAVSSKQIKVCESLIGERENL